MEGEPQQPAMSPFKRFAALPEAAGLYNPEQEKDACGLAIIATVSGVIASVFAVSRMLAMLTDMKLVPHSHFGMPGDDDLPLCVEPELERPPRVGPARRLPAASRTCRA